MNRQTLWFALALLLVGMASLLRVQRYYGKLLHGWDAQFYYAQARSLVVSGSLDLTDSLPLAPDQGPFADSAGPMGRVPRRENGRIFNKYPIGLSLLEAPWLELGRGVRQAWQSVSGQTFPEPDGFSPVEVGAVALGLLLYAVLGLALLSVLVVREVPGAWGGFVVVVGALGTSLFYYTAVFPFMAHGAAFALVVLLLWLARSLARAERTSIVSLVALAVAAGLLVLVRPQQGVLLLLLAPWVAAGAGRLGRSKLWLLLPLLLFVALVAALPLSNRLRGGPFAVNAYAAAGEGFTWDRPRLDVVLWRVDRGLLWMSPVVLLALWGYVLGRAWRSSLAWVLLLHALAQVYLIAAWSSPEQGDSFGARMWCECMPFVALGLAYLLREGGPRPRTLWAGLAVACACWTCLLLLLYLKSPDLSGYTYGEFLLRALRFWQR